MSATPTGTVLQLSWTGRQGGRGLRFLISLFFRDNADGGTNGPETVTLQGTLTNSQHDYLVAINDFEFNNNGEDFYSSMSSINILNQLQSYDINMVGNSGSLTEAYYFFGCLEISSGLTLPDH